MAAEVQGIETGEMRLRQCRSEKAHPGPLAPGDRGLYNPLAWTAALRGAVRSNRMGNSVTVAQLTLDQLVKVRILVPQLTPLLRPRRNAKRQQALARKSRVTLSAILPLLEIKWGLCVPSVAPARLPLGCVLLYPRDEEERPWHPRKDMARRPLSGPGERSTWLPTPESRASSARPPARSPQTSWLAPRWTPSGAWSLPGSPPAG
jgi:hypothetical protein